MAQDEHNLDQLLVDLSQAVSNALMLVNILRSLRDNAQRLQEPVKLMLQEVQETIERALTQL
jgi:hypothetical protein